jgi:SPP1 gp7 family putative phage head morphogenesis protein
MAAAVRVVAVPVEGPARIVYRDAKPRTVVKRVVRGDPVHPVMTGGKITGYQWGQSGKVYKSRKKAQAQAAAIFASGYRGDSGVLRDRRKVHRHLSANRAAEDTYTSAIVALFRGVHRGIMGMVEKDFLPKPESRRDETHEHWAGEFEGVERPALNHAAPDVASLKPIAEGANRKVYEHGNGGVLKVAKNAKARAENKAEVEASGKNPLLARISQYGERYAWVRQEKLAPASNEQLAKAFGVSSADAGKKYDVVTKDPWGGDQVVRGKDWLFAATHAVNGGHPSPVRSAGKFVSALTQLKHDVPGLDLADVAYANQWGLDPSGSPKILDYGFAEKKDASHLDASPTVKQANAVFNDRLNRKIAKHLRERAGPAWDVMARRVAAKNAQALSLIGIPVQAHDPGTQAKIAESMENNLRLIEDAGRAYAEDVRDVLTDPDNEGVRAEDLQGQIMKAGVDNLARASLIATDQTLKLHSAVTRSRQAAAGITRWRWSTSLDERVRDSHAALEGEVFGFDDYATSENGVENEAGIDGEPDVPGNPIRCRCVQIPIIEGLDEETPDTEEDDAAAE